jgi:sigma-B regulation protein RsbU (phosphoserine phosphatase)
MFGAVDYMTNKGIVGGLLKSAYFQGYHAGRLAEQILKGKAADDLPIIMQSPLAYIFDYQQLERFNIDNKRLPAGSKLINEPQGFYYRYKALIWSVISILGLMLIFIIILLLNIKQRKRAQKGLQSILETSNTPLNIHAHNKFKQDLMRDLSSVLPNLHNIFLMRYKGKPDNFNEKNLSIIDTKHKAIINDSAKKLVIEALNKTGCVFNKNDAVAFLQSDNSPVNLLYVNGKQRLDKIDHQLFELFASNVSMSIDNVETYKLSASLQTAQRIQSAMLPTNFAPVASEFQLDLHAFILPAKEVGGDLYDFFALDQDNICLYVGDVSGKGVPAAIFMAMAKTVLRSTADISLSPDEILYRSNNELSRDNTETMFVTLFLVIFNHKTGQLRYSNGGHNIPYFISAEGEVSPLKTQGGIALGVMEDLPYFMGNKQLEEGDALLLYTDGVTEATNTEDELYGEDRLIRYLNQHPHASAKQVNTLLLEDIHDFVTDAQQSDDITSMFMRFIKD